MIRKTPFLIGFLVGCDLLMLGGSFGLSYLYRFEFSFRPAAYVPTWTEVMGVAAFVFLLWGSLAVLVGLYKEENVPLSDEIGRILFVIPGVFILFLALLFVYRSFWFSRQIALTSAVFMLVGVFVIRLVVWVGQTACYRRGWFTRKVVILGKGEDADHLYERLKTHPQTGIEPMTRLSDIAELDRELAHGKIQEVFIADRNLSTSDLLNLITRYSLRNIRFHIVPGVLDLLASRVSVAEAGDIPLLTIRDVGLRGGKALLKRSFDVLLSLMTLIILAPIFLLVALVIRLDSHGPILIRQSRIGRDGLPFQMLKFRSMRLGANVEEEHLRHLSGQTEGTFKLQNDPRVTRVGSWLRRFSFDELPQLWNVLRGEMSLVGPRPALPQEVAKYSDWNRKRLRIRPGVTGLWQVSGRSDISFPEMIRLDLFYIENWSLWLDCKLLLRTIPVVIMGKGAY